jgi:hypothetical protein
MKRNHLLALSVGSLALGLLAIYVGPRHSTALTLVGLLSVFVSVASLFGYRLWALFNQVRKLFF